MKFYYEAAKEVKAMEAYRKLAAQSQEFRELFEVFEKLEKGDHLPSEAL